MLPTPSCTWGFTGHNAVVRLNVPGSAVDRRMTPYRERAGGVVQITAGTWLPAATIPSRIRTLDKRMPPMTKKMTRAMMAQR